MQQTASIRGNKRGECDMVSKLLLIGFFLILIVLGVRHMAKFYHWEKPIKSAYKKQLGKIHYPDGFLNEFSAAYFATENLEYAIDLIEKKYIDGNLNAHILAAKEYLECSRYKDYETALQFLSDGSPEFREVYQRILAQEDNKRHRLPLSDHK